MKSTLAISVAVYVFVITQAVYNKDDVNKTKFYGYDQLGKADLNARMRFVMELKEEEHKKCVAENRCPTRVPSQSREDCVNGKAGEYDCQNIDLLSFVSVEDLGCGGDLNDIWGWRDDDTGSEYALVGCADGTSFVDVTKPEEPLVLGFLRTRTTSSLWRDIKVIGNYAFIVSKATDHGMQIYNLHKLRSIKNPSAKNFLIETAHYSEFGSAHNIVANEETNFVYSVGSKTCNGGLHIVNVKNPLKPTYSGCFGDDSYVHDAQCVIYKGPDSKYTDREICFCYNEDSLTIVDVQDKSNMEMIARMPYNGSQYTHQGWLMEKQDHLVLNDELDELYGGNKHTRSMIWDVNDLKNPVLVDSFYSEKTATDHNLYIRGKYVYESNYCAGMRVLEIDTQNDISLKEIGYFDLAPDCDEPGFQGAWSSYPYYKENFIIAVSSIERGLFLLKFNKPE